MSQDVLNEREFELINIVGAELNSNQRDLSRHMDLSLGMTNILIRRLIAKGYIRIKQLNKRKVQYILTPKGFTEKMQKSVKYTLKTINSIGLILEHVKTKILELYNKGERNFFVLGGSDLVVLVETVFKECALPECVVSRINEFPQHEVDGIILICKEDCGGNEYNSTKQIDLIEELSKHHTFN